MAGEQAILRAQNDRSYNARALPQFVAFARMKLLSWKQFVTKEMRARIRVGWWIISFSITVYRTIIAEAIMEMLLMRLYVPEIKAQFLLYVVCNEEFASFFSPHQRTE